MVCALVLQLLHLNSSPDRHIIKQICNVMRLQGGTLHFFIVQCVLCGSKMCFSVRAMIHISSCLFLF